MSKLENTVFYTKLAWFASEKRKLIPKDSSGTSPQKGLNLNGGS